MNSLDFTTGKRLPVMSCRLVRERSEPMGEPLTGPPALAQAARLILGDMDREGFLVLFLNAKNRITGMSLISVGDLQSAIVHPREVFKAAILAGAAGIAIAHNHPSGECTPSAEDLAVNRRLMEAGLLLGIPVLDHVVLGDGCFTSLKEKGLM